MKWALPVFVTTYAVTSSSLLVLNKLFVDETRAPAFLLLCQVTFSTVYVLFMVCLGKTTLNTSDMRRTLSRFVVIVCSFVGGIYANMRTLEILNVETVIVFRSCTVLLVCLVETAFLNRGVPSRKSWLSLVSITIFSLLYVKGDVHFDAYGYVWLLLWFVLLVFSMTYVKHVCDTGKLSTWEQVFLTNALSMPLIAAVIALSAVEISNVRQIAWTRRTSTVFALSCMCGVGISFSSYYIRRDLSATMFDLIGIVCKFVSVLLNILCGLKRASNSGTACLVAIVLSAFFYQQPPLRVALRESIAK